jgi:hypothetical protein
MLVFVAILSAGAFLVHDYVRIRNAREHFEYVWASWNAGRVSDDDVISASETLANMEAESPWVSMSAADRSHIARLQRIIHFLDSGTCESSPEVKERRRERLNENIRKHS